MFVNYRMKLFVRIAGIVYFDTLFYIFFLARRRPHPTLFLHKGPVNLVPLKNKLEEIGVYRIMTIAEKWNFNTDLFGNIALFIPLPFFLAFIFNVQSFWKSILVALAASTCVELIQYIFSIGVADIDDVILNTCGAVTGFLLMKLLVRIFPGFAYPSGNE